MKRVEGEESRLQHVEGYREVNRRDTSVYTASSTMRVALIILLCFLVDALVDAGQVDSCGYSSCPVTDPSLVNVHIVPHTHDDVGWKKTVQQYFWGTRNDITHITVKHIIDSVIRELDKDAAKRFMYVESAFFWLWWRQASSASRDSLKQLVNSGRLEIVSGGWSMNDEACVHYQSTIDQMTWGHRRLVDSLGNCSVPRVGWQIDPFGHSREQAFINSQMSFDALFFARAHYLDIEKRRKNHQMQMIWRTSDDLPATDLFTGILSDHYEPPKGFNFDIVFRGDNVVDDVQSEEYNIRNLTETMILDALDRSALYNSSNIMLTFGSDFHFQDASGNFDNIDKIINSVNERQRSGSKVNLFYSTPSCFVYNLNLEGKQYSRKDDDFFPYASEPHAFWTGYFTSRPALKLYERHSNLLLQSCKWLQVFANLTSERDDEAVAVLKEAMGIAQHHDAVSGTEKEHVARDYALQLNKGSLQCLPVIERSLNQLLPSVHPHPIHHCPLLNVSVCSISETEKAFTLIVHNVLAWNRPNHLINLPWTDDGARVVDSNGDEIQVDIVPIPQSVLSLPERNGSKATTELTFQVSLPPSSLSTLSIQRVPRDKLATVSRASTIPSRGLLVASKSHRIFFDSRGTMQHLTLSDGSKLNLNQSFLVYRSMSGNNSDFDTRASGAYIFRPNGTAEPIDAHSDAPMRATYLKSKSYTQIHQQITPWLRQSIRVNLDDDLIHFDYQVGPIDISDGIGKEVITRYSSDLSTNGTFYTDSNGRQLVKRVRNNWNTFEYLDTEPIAGNYYPVNSRIIVRDVHRDVQVTVFTDRTQGGSSLTDGNVELMLHRRMLFDDGFGVQEALNEPGFDNKGLIIRGAHRVLVSSIADSCVHRQLAIQMHLPPVLYFSASTVSAETINSLSVIDALPPSVHLLTVENWRNGDTLIRLEHIYQRSDPSPFSDRATVNIEELFRNFSKIGSVTELTLSANAEASTTRRLNWHLTDGSSGSFNTISTPIDPSNITLDAMQIRTLLIKWADN